MRAYRHTISIHTTNGVERQNEELKYNFLASHRDKSLSGVLSVLITEFFPDKYARYVHNAVKEKKTYCATIGCRP